MKNNETKEELLQSIQRELSSKNISYENVHSITIRDKEKTDTDHIPRELFSMFPKLNIFEVSDSGVAVITSDDFANAKELTHLYIPRSKLRILTTGTFQVEKLKILDLSQNEISTIDDFTFASLRSLTNLDLSGNKLTTISRNTLSGLNELYRLDLDKNEIRTIENGAFADLRKLEILYLYENKLRVLNDHMFDGLRNLNIISVADNQIMSIGKSLDALPALREIYLKGNPINDIDLVKFSYLLNLQKLDLSRTGLTLENYNSNSKLWSDSPLVHLNLAFNNITNIVSLRVLRVFPNIETISLTGNGGLADKKGPVQQLLYGFAPKLNVVAI